MAIDNASYIANMNTTVPSNDDPRSEGAEQIQAVKRAVQQSFPNIDGPVTATAEQLNVVASQANGVGDIKIFYGDIADIQAGWVIADGEIHNSKQTPDLRGMTIIGYNPEDEATTPIGSTGGSDEITLTGQLTSEHVLTVSELPPHHHDQDPETIIAGAPAGNVDPLSGSSPSGHKGGTTQDSGGGLGHSHQLEEVTFDNRSAFVILAFIMYVGLPA